MGAKYSGLNVREKLKEGEIICNEGTGAAMGAPGGLSRVQRLGKVRNLA